VRLRFVLLLSFTLLLSSCRPHGSGIVVGSKNFGEQLVLGELLAQKLEATGLPVTRRFYLGGTYIAHQALLAGRIDMYPEYTGTALTAILKLPPATDPEQVYKTVKQQYAERYQLEVGPPLGFNNSFAIAMRGDEAQRLGIRTLSDLARHAPELRMGVGYEFLERKDGYPGLTRTYGLHFASAPRVMDLGLLYRALQAHEVDVVAGSNTDPQIAQLGLVVLDDNLHYFPPYDAVPVVRQETVRNHPEVEKILHELAGAVSVDDIRRMNRAVDIEHRDVRSVVREFLQRKP
jgi:osmoprotectant transport system substrate-binding protein